MLFSAPISGTIAPTLGTDMDRLSDTLFGQTRGAVLAVLFGHPSESYYLRQLVRTTGKGMGAVQKEVKQLLEAGLVTKNVIGNQTFYQANSGSPVFSEIKGLVTKTVGVHDILRAALNPLRSHIQAAFVYGSIAKQTETANSDIDLMVVGDVDFGQIATRLGQAQRQLSREINPTLYPPPEWQSKLAANNHFLKDVLSGEKLFIFGDEDELRRMGEKRMARKTRKPTSRNQESFRDSR